LLPKLQFFQSSSQICNGFKKLFLADLKTVLYGIMIVLMRWI